MSFSNSKMGALGRWSARLRGYTTLVIWLRTTRSEVRLTATARANHPLDSTPDRFNHMSDRRRVRRSRHGCHVVRLPDPGIGPDYFGIGRWEFCQGELKYEIPDLGGNAAIVQGRRELGIDLFRLKALT